MIEPSLSGNREKLRTASLIAAAVGALGSVCLMLMAGLHPPVLLVVLFIGWVLAPFAALVLAIILSRRWSEFTKNTVYAVTFVVAICSLAVYGYVLVRPAASQPAFPYVAVPLLSWLLIFASVAVSALVSRRKEQTMK
jgi:FtsH-binding integral membrane protein